MPEAAEKPPQTPPAGAQPGVFADPFRAYNFKLVIQGVTEGHFIECSNMGIRVQALQWREGGISQVVHRLPGPVEYADITLRYGVTNSRELWEWFLSAVKGRVQRKNISIVMLDADGVTEVLRWDLLNAWPSTWRGAPLDALGREVAIEELTLVFETLDRG
jgi:phage tail-like protein